MEEGSGSALRTVLFICTGNVYRSRYAEAYFNHLARRESLPLRAFSRGLRVELVEVDISPYTIEALERRGIGRDMTAPGRRNLTVDDLERADLVVALRESEHRPIIAERFPQWESRLRYWDVADHPEWSADRMVAAVERNIEELVEELRRSLPRSQGSTGPRTARKRG